MKHRSLLGLSVIALAGCGGGGGAPAGGGEPTPGGTANQFGPIETRGQVKGTPIIRDLLNISTVALAGTLTDATYRPQGRPDNETAIVVGVTGVLDFFTESGTPIATWNPKYPGAALYPNRPRWSPDGQRVYFNSGNSLYYAAVSAPDTAVRVLTDVSQYFALSPDGTKIAFSRYAADGNDLEVYTSTVSGGSQTRITTNAANDIVDVWADDGSIVTHAGSSATRIDLAGTFINGYSSSGRYPLGRSSDGRYFFDSEPTDTSFTFGVTELYNTVFAAGSFLPGPPVSGLVSAGSSPDGKRWVLVENEQVTTTEVIPQYRYSLLGKTTQPYRGGDWQPALGLTKFVGSGGRLGTTSAGMVATFRQGEGRNGLSSFVNWDCQTRSTSTVNDDPTDVNAGSKTYTIEGDRLTALRYGNHPFFQNIATVSSTGTANGAIVTLETRNGTVTNIVVYQETRGAKPTIRREGGSKIIEGTIQGVWNAQGENLAPNGTNRVVISEKGEASL